MPISSLVVEGVCIERLGYFKRISNIFFTEKVIFMYLFAVEVTRHDVEGEFAAMKQKKTDNQLFFDAMPGNFNS